MVEKGVDGPARPAAKFTRQAKLTRSARSSLLGYDLDEMSDDDLSSGQQALLEGLRGLDALDLGSAEPAAVFRPAAWASNPAGGFDLAALAPLATKPATDATDGAKATNGADATSAGGTINGPDGTDPHDERAADGSRSRDADSLAAAEELPPACRGATEIVADVFNHETTATEVLEAARARIEACDAALNAFITTSPERAAREAAIVDEVVAAGERPRPLAGVPLAHKDIIATGGLRTTAGSALLRDHVPDEDATVVARLSNAGTLLMGKTNTHEFATGTTGTVSHFGAVRNPWDPAHMSGGSSSGSGAALAAGMVAAATGTDTGGSIRLPAACCGIVGLKPTYGRVSRCGVMPFAWGLDHVGPMALRVRDVALLLTAMAGPDPNDRAAAGEAAGNFSTNLDQGVRGLRFSVPTFQFLELATQPVAEAVLEAARVFEDLGAKRVDADMPRELAHVGPAAIALFLAEGGAVHRRTLSSHPELYCEQTRAFLALAGRVSADTYLQAQRLRAIVSDAMARVFQKVDLLLTPTLAMTAPRRDARTVEGADGPIDVRAAMTLFTRPFNLTGLPALSMPCGFDAGLPIGLQLVGRPFDEATVLRAAHAYETAAEWHARRPPLFP